MTPFNKLLLGAALGLFLGNLAFGNAKATEQMDEKLGAKPFNVVKFVKSFLPENVDSQYVEKVASVYADTLKRKLEIVHEGRLFFGKKQLIPPNTVTKDYGWNFPCVLRVQKHLLQFLASQKEVIDMIDVGPGWGFDSIHALLTDKANVFAIEKQKPQCKLLKDTVSRTILGNVDPYFPLEKRFTVHHGDFLNFRFSSYKPGKAQGLNANKVIHFFDERETKKFETLSKALVRKKGRMFLTGLTPTPDGKIEKFMQSQEGDFPGYVFYRQKTELLEGNIPGKSVITEVRKPKKNEESAHFYQTYIGLNTKRGCQIVCVSSQI